MIKELRDELKSAENIYFAQIYSSRSYKTGSYNIISDGNLALTLDLIMQLPKNVNCTITYPDDSNFDEFKSLFKSVVPNVKWVPKKYGKNVVETRKHSIDISDAAEADVIVTCFTNHTKSSKNKKLFLMANVSPVQGFMRTELDEHYADFNSSEFDAIYVLNDNQVDFFGYSNCKRLDIIYYGDFTSAKKEVFSSDTVKQKIEERLEELIDFDKPYLFHPFRLSDNDYNLQELTKTYKQIIVLDTNDSVDMARRESPDVKFIELKSLVNEDEVNDIYYTALSMELPIIVYADCVKIVHIGLFEIFDLVHCAEFVLSSSVQFIEEASA